MPEVRPFRGVRYAGVSSDRLGRLVTAPYDVITTQAQADYYARDEFNAIRLELSEQTAADNEDDNRYTRAASTYREWRNSGALQAESGPALYVARESFQMDGGTRTRTTLFALVRLYNWGERQVLPHERTMPKPKADRLELLRASQVQFSPIFSLYDDPDSSVAELLDDVIRQQPVADFELNPPAVAAAPERMRVWQVGDPVAIGAIASAISQRAIYIADGHHRYETALAYRDAAGPKISDGDQPRSSDYLMMSLSASNDPGVDVMATHRLIQSAGPGDFIALATSLGPKFAPRPLDGSDIEVFLQEPDDTALRVVAVSKKETKLMGLRLTADPARLSEMPADRHPSWKTLDVACLHELVLKPHFGLDDADLAAEAGVEYTRDPQEVITRVHSAEFNWGFILRPTRLQQVLDVARAGETMPPKSTYFYPKTVTGLVFFDHREPL